MEEGDVLITNSNDHGGFHRYSLVAVTPFDFGVKGQKRMYLALNQWLHKAPLHCFDITSVYPDNFMPAFPPVELVSKGTIDSTVADILLANTTEPAHMKAALNATTSSLDLGLEMLETSIRRYGPDDMEALGEALIKHTHSSLQRQFRSQGTELHAFKDGLPHTSGAAQLTMTTTMQQTLYGFAIELVVEEEELGKYQLTKGALHAAILQALALNVENSLPMNAGYNRFYKLAAVSPALVTDGQRPISLCGSHLYQRITAAVSQLLCNRQPGRATVQFASPPARLIWNFAGNFFNETIPSGHTGPADTNNLFALFSM